MVEWASKVKTGDTETIDWDGTPVEVPLTIILTQVINHATEHHAQVMATLTQLGIEPPELDSWTYFQRVVKSFIPTIELNLTTGLSVDWWLQIERSLRLNGERVADNLTVTESLGQMLPRVSARRTNL